MTKPLLLDTCALQWLASSHDRIEDKLAEARADVAAGRVKPMDQVMNRLRSKFNGPAC